MVYGYCTYLRRKTRPPRIHGRNNWEEPWRDRSSRNTLAHALYATRQGMCVVSRYRPQMKLSKVLTNDVAFWIVELQSRALATMDGGVLYSTCRYLLGLLSNGPEQSMITGGCSPGLSLVRVGPGPDSHTHTKWAVSDTLLAIASTRNFRVPSSDKAPEGFSACPYAQVHGSLYHQSLVRVGPDTSLYAW